ncbi:MAG: molybdopterin-binding protein [Sphingobacterium sp.]|uniref:molybdopterin-binding protein n=1 Tax=Sphingobacterium sp. JB170 TaxID=1434842 RepID=UPI00097F6472|nr:molybdopterin-binding protein [Sphingobacterium sp. JB170]SJN45620.1 Molybdenum cofactor biosynthesis protein MoaB [Sphingobacterium sp. JB170]
MLDISNNTLRRRRSSAVSVVYCTQDCVNQLKIDLEHAQLLFSQAKLAGYQAAKLTAQIFASRHVLPIDALAITFSYVQPSTDQLFFTNYPNYEAGILVCADGSSLVRAPIDMECLSAATAASLQLYEQLFYTAGEIEIGSMKLLPSEDESSSNMGPLDKLRCAVLVCSDSIASKSRENKSGDLVIQILEEHHVTLVDHRVLPCALERIQKQVQSWAAQDVDFIFTCGATGLGVKDLIYEAINPLLHKKVEGVTHAMYAHGTLHSSRAMFSRTVAGTIGQSFIVTLPGSSKGVQESLKAILPDLFYAKKMLSAKNS